MKKYYILFIALFIFSISLFSCKDNTKSDIEYLNDVLNSFSFGDTLNGDLELAEEYKVDNKTIKATWTSSNDKILSNDGKFYYTFKTSEVSLNVKLELNGETLEHSFDFFTLESGEKVFDYIDLGISNEIYSSLNLSKTITYGKYNIKSSFTSSDTSIMSNDGKITLSNIDKQVELKAKYTYQSYSQEYTYNITIKAIDEAYIKQELSKIDIKSEYDGDIDLVYSINYYNDTLDVTYESNNLNILSNNGKVTPADTKTDVVLRAKTIFDIYYDFTISILPMSDETALNLAIKDIYLPTMISSDLLLSTTYAYNTNATWVSSDESILNNNGHINGTVTNKDVKLTLTLCKGNSTMEKEFNIKVNTIEHLYQDRTFDGNKTNVIVKNGKIVLNNDALSGTYETGEIQTREFYEAVGSYAATSSENATCEYSVSIYAGGKWSKYFSYGEWGQGRQNACHDQSDTYCSLTTDEIKTSSGVYASAFKLKIVLKRDSLSTASPVVSLLALALNFKDYTYDIDISNLPKEVNWDVPCLYQHDVPSIGGSICSVTSSTMLLKFKGHDFTSINPLEHEYMAYIIRDYGNNIFGNWVYNTIAMSSFGEIAYVKRFYSSNELIYSLATLGPMAASIKGTAISNKKTYTTNGHLIVVTGYKIEGNQTYIYVNDPNVYGVKVVMTLENFLAVNRMVSYIIE